MQTDKQKQGLAALKVAEDAMKKMRDAQKEYFKTRSSDSLHRSKDYERKVDEVLSSREKRVKEEREPSLFE